MTHEKRSSDVHPESRGRTKSRLLLRVATGELEPWDVILLANEGGHAHPACDITLRELLDERDRPMSGGNLTFLIFVGELVGASGVERKTVGWLVDGRAGGRRLAAWREAEVAGDLPPGFPWSRLDA